MCGRHLDLFGYDVTILYPKEPKAELYKVQKRALTNMNDENGREVSSAASCDN